MSEEIKKFQSILVNILQNNGVPLQRRVVWMVKFVGVTEEEAKDMIFGRALATDDQRAKIVQNLGLEKDPFTALPVKGKVTSGRTPTREERELFTKILIETLDSFDVKSHKRASYLHDNLGITTLTAYKWLKGTSAPLKTKWAFIGKDLNKNPELFAPADMSGRGILAADPKSHNEPLLDSHVEVIADVATVGELEEADRLKALEDEAEVAKIIKDVDIPKFGEKVQKIKNSVTKQESMNAVAAMNESVASTAPEPDDHRLAVDAKASIERAVDKIDLLQSRKIKAASTECIGTVIELMDADKQGLLTEKNFEHLHSFIQGMVALNKAS